MKEGSPTEYMGDKKQMVSKMQKSNEELIEQSGAIWYINCSNNETVKQCSQHGGRKISQLGINKWNNMKNVSKQAVEKDLRWTQTNGEELECIERD